MIACNRKMDEWILLVQEFYSLTFVFPRDNMEITKKKNANCVCNVRYAQTTAFNNIFIFFPEKYFKMFRSRAKVKRLNLMNA